MSFHRTGSKFGREKGLRTALVKSLVRSLIIHEAITTTEAKAKTLRPVVEKLVTRARTATLADRRILASRIGDAKAVKKLVDVLARGRTRAAPEDTSALSSFRFARKTARKWRRFHS